jgi:hypothetical protein
MPKKAERHVVEVTKMDMWSGEIQDQPGDQAGYDEHVERPVAFGTS